MDRNILPHGATGIETEDFAVAFGDDKIVFIPKSESAGKHYTLHTGPNSGVIDLHETTLDEAGRKHYSTLFTLRHDALADILGECVPMLPALFSLLRPLRLGWLKHRDIGIAWGIDLVSDEDIAAATSRNRRRRLTLDLPRYEQNLCVPEYLEEVYDFPDGNFTLFHRGRPIGIGFKKTDAAGRIRLHWIKRRDLTRFGNIWQEKVGRAFSQAAASADVSGHGHASRP